MHRAPLRRWAPVLLATLVVLPALGTAAPASALPSPCGYPESTDYRVEAGDTLYSIARCLLGDGSRHLEIFRLNQGERQADGGRLTDPGVLRVGWLLRLPPEIPSGGGGGTGGGGGEPDPDDSLGSGEAYTVRAGDTLSGIAAARLGDPARYLEIFEINRNRPQVGGGALTDPGRLTVGWVLELPHRGPGAGGDAAGGRRHTVVAGESLSSIAREQLGDQRRFQEIFDLNVGRPQAAGGTLRDPSLLRVGWVLRLPPR